MLRYWHIAGHDQSITHGGDSFQVLVELAQLQDDEVGDGTTSVVIVAAELLKNAEELTRQKIHPTSIIAGYRLAMKESVKYIKEHLTYKVESIHMLFI